MTERLHPALGRLIRSRYAARFQKLYEQATHPSRRWKTLAAVLLAVLWLGNALATLVFREPYAAADFRFGVSHAIALYFLWSVTKVAASRPPAPFDWKPAERHLLLTGPFSRRQLAAYRVADSLPATCFKSASIVFFFQPELPLWWAGLLGAMLGFRFLELLRLIVNVAACGAPDRLYRIGRAVVVGLLIGIAGVALQRTVTDPQLAASPLVAWSLARTFAVHAGDVLFQNLGGGLLILAFSPFTNLLLAERLGWYFAFDLSCAVTLCLVAERMLYALNDRLGDDERAFHPVQQAKKSQVGARFRRIPHWNGIGPVAWRQWNTACDLGHGVALALLAPIVLACGPLLLNLDAENTFLNVVAGAAFYSLLLLPSGLKFDFRMDYERLHLLKSLPIRPIPLVVGQILVPVAITIGYQLFVIGLAFAVRPVPWPFVVAAFTILVPTTVVIYAVDNTLFLFSPHRLRQDGFEVLLKGLLTFTAKGLVFALGVAFVLVWVETSVSLDATLTELGLPLGRRAVFATGLALSTTAAAALSVGILARTFTRCEAVPRAE